MDLKLVHDGTKVRVLDGPYLEDGKPTKQAVEYYESLVSDLDTFRRFAATNLLDLYNSNWLDDDIGEVDVEGFMARLSNPAVMLFDELGAAMILFEDGGLFAGHWIEVSVQNMKPTHTGIAG